MLTIALKLMGRKLLERQKKRKETVKFKNYTRKIKSSSMIYADFESILVP